MTTTIKTQSTILPDKPIKDFNSWAEYIHRESEYYSRYRHISTVEQRAKLISNNLKIKSHDSRNIREC